MTHIILILMALLAANAPWFSERLFYLIPLKGERKSIAWCLLELVVLYFALGVLAYGVEKSSMGQVAPQNWEFYAVTASLFLVFAFPGFVYRYLWRQ